MSFQELYDRAAARWPAGYSSLHVDTTWGQTHLLTAGPDEAPPLLLLHGDGATATAWAEVAEALAGRYRILAPDQPGNPGRSCSSRPFRSTADMVGWLAEVLTATRTGAVHLVGHSAGAHLALSYALAHQQRVAGLVLLDPTFCFAGLSAAYLARAAPMLVRPTDRNVRRFLAWETGGRQLPHAWEELFVEGATDFDRTPIVRTRRPRRDQLAALCTPTLVLLAAAGRAQRSPRVAEKAAAVRCVTVEQIAGATHHTMPVLDAPATAAAIDQHIRSSPGSRD